jgi:aryl-alcohol dehydrogenase-like predicted oxidoreductase
MSLPELLFGAAPAVTSVVVGARTPEEIVADAGYLSSVVPEELMVELASINNQ